MVDILDDSDSLYSGIYTEYHIEDGRLSSISLSNVIRFAFRDASEREEKRSSGQQESPPYIMPNQGEMYFPIDRVRNFHIWRIPARHEFKKDMEGPVNQVLLAWYSALKFALPWLNIRVAAKVSKDTKDIGVFIRNFSRLKLDPSIIDFEFEKDERRSPKAPDASN
ncbi:MAG: hypothetical protein AB7F86_09720 [Bdellovibrionales bacterium]